MRRHDDDPLNALLARRAAPPPPRPDLAGRIIHAALAQIESGQRKLSLWREMLGMFVLPHPAAALAATVLIGLAAGWQTGDFNVSLPDWSTFLDVNEGNWS